MTLRSLPSPVARRPTLFYLILSFLIPHAAFPSDIPAPKRALIVQALAAMKIDQRLQGLIDARVEAKVRDVQAANPGMPDSLLPAVRAEVAAVYALHRDTPDGLMERVYVVIDRRLSEDDLRFVSDFRGSDQGRRYRELIPRVVPESVEAGRAWSEGLDPLIRQRLEERFRGSGYVF